MDAKDIPAPEARGAPQAVPSGAQAPAGQGAPAQKSGRAGISGVLSGGALLYSVRTFAAALAALWLAFALDLPQPGWAMMTVYVVSQAYAGMVLSKSLARIAGTLAGAVAGVVLVALFNACQPLFVAALSLWIGGCLYFSVLLRDAPAAYGTMLAGFTAALIAAPSVVEPLRTFDYAVARLLEISIAIVCATLASRLVFPRTMGGILRSAVRRCVDDTRAWMLDTLRERGDERRRLADLRAVIAGNVSLESLRVHAERDTVEIRAAGAIVRRVQARLVAVSALLVSVHDRVALLARERPGALARLRPLLTRVADRIEGGDPAVDPALDTDLDAVAPDFSAMREVPACVLEYNLILRLRDLLAGWRSTLLLVDAFEKGGEAPPVSGEECEDGDGPPARYRDHVLALVSALVSATAVATVCAFWILTGWDFGAAAVSITGVVVCIMSTSDDPVRSARVFTNMTLLSALITAVYLFAVIPAVDGFPMLAAAFAVLLIPGGMFIATPRHAPYAIPLCLHVIVLMELAARMEPRPQFFFNNALGLMVGLVAGSVMLALLRPVGSEWTVRRLMAGLMRDVAAIALEPESRARLSARMLDRVGALRTQPDLARSGAEETLQGALGLLRIGLNCGHLGGWRRNMPPALEEPVRLALKAVSAHLRHLSRHPGNPAGLTPLPRLDAALSAVLKAGADSFPDAVHVLAVLFGIRTTFAEHRRFFRLP
ncbi:MAG: FUSC family protein [Puniceicoccales bacterium]|jgi:uncharacterized membrane protein YccC|nr:FUSC family protein [Puniceicoccales bacterium]